METKPLRKTPVFNDFHGDSDQWLRPLTPSMEDKLEKESHKAHSLQLLLSSSSLAYCVAMQSLSSVALIGVLIVIVGVGWRRRKIGYSDSSHALPARLAYLETIWIIGGHVRCNGLGHSKSTCKDLVQSLGHCK